MGGPNKLLHREVWLFLPWLRLCMFVSIAQGMEGSALYRWTVQNQCQTLLVSKPLQKVCQVSLNTRS